jgi:hypothetical protein
MCKRQASSDEMVERFRALPTAAVPDALANDSEYGLSTSI